MDLSGERGRAWAYSTVATLLRRLEAKGYAASEPVGGPLVYRATVSREDLIDRRLKDAAADPSVDLTVTEPRSVLSGLTIEEMAAS